MRLPPMPWSNTSAPDGRLGSLTSWSYFLIGLGGSAWIYVATGFGGFSEGPVDVALTAAVQVLIFVAAVGYMRQARTTKVGILVLFYALLVIAFIGDYASSYLTLNSVDGHAFPQPFGRFEAVYLALGTFTPAAGVAVVPADNAARALVLSESMVAWILIGIGLAVVVSRLTAVVQPDVNSSAPAQPGTRRRA